MDTSRYTDTKYVLTHTQEARAAALYEAAQTQQDVFLHAAQRLRTSLDAMLPQSEREVAQMLSAHDLFSTVEHIEQRLETLREFVFICFFDIFLFVAYKVSTKVTCHATHLCVFVVFVCKQVCTRK